MLQRGLELTVALVPVRRATMKSRNEVQFLFRQLRPEQIAEEPMETEPPTWMIEPEQEQVLPGDPLELLRGALFLQHSVAEGSRQCVEH